MNPNEEFNQNAYNEGYNDAKKEIKKHLKKMLKDLQTRKWESVEEVDQYFIDNLEKYE
jgi:tryptophanyl-tRNA synthetase